MIIQRTWNTIRAQNKLSTAVGLIRAIYGNQTQTYKTHIPMRTHIDTHLVTLKLGQCEPAKTLLRWKKRQKRDGLWRVKVGRFTVEDRFIFAPTFRHSTAGVMELDCIQLHPLSPCKLYVMKTTLRKLQNFALFHMIY